MVVLKAIILLIAGLLSVLAIRHVMHQMQVVKVRANRRPHQRASQVRRLRQDPRTGIYYPEN